MGADAGREPGQGCGADDRAPSRVGGTPARWRLRPEPPPLAPLQPRGRSVRLPGLAGVAGSLGAGGRVRRRAGGHVPIRLGDRALGRRLPARPAALPDPGGQHHGPACPERAATSRAVWLWAFSYSSTWQSPIGLPGLDAAILL